MQRDNLPTPELIENIQAAKNALEDEGSEMDDLSAFKSILKDEQVLLSELVEERMQFHDIEFFHSKGNLDLFLKSSADKARIAEILPQVHELYTLVYNTNPRFFSDNRVLLKDKELTPDFFKALNRSLFADKKTYVIPKQGTFSKTLESLYELLKDIFNAVDKERVVHMQNQLQAVIVQLEVKITKLNASSAAASSSPRISK